MKVSSTGDIHSDVTLKIIIFFKISQFNIMKIEQFKALEILNQNKKSETVNYFVLIKNVCR